MGELALEHLSEKDIRILVRHPDPEKRALAAQRICRMLRSSSLSESETKLATDLLKYMQQEVLHEQAHWLLDAWETALANQRKVRELVV